MARDGSDIIFEPRGLGQHLIIKPEPVGFGMAAEKREGSTASYDDGIALQSMAHPHHAAPWRNAIARGLVRLATLIGDQQWYGRDK